MSNILLDNTSNYFREHHNFPDGEDVSIHFETLPPPILFKNNHDCICIDFKTSNEVKTLHTSYYIGVDWVYNDTAIYVEPKLNKHVNTETDYLKILFDCLKHPEILPHTKDLFEIKFDKPLIEIDKSQDHLTPLLVIYFLRLVESIVRKGLKKSYYKVEQNLNAKIKGKVLIGKTLKDNVFKNKPLMTFCSYDEFGFDNTENRILKKTLIFIQQYVSSLESFRNDKNIISSINYALPAFKGVSEDVNLHEAQQTKINLFYKEYQEAIRIAKLILKRFGYNISNTKLGDKISIPPFWIDMAKLFEFYVLGLLKDKYKSNVIFQFNANYGQPDYILVNERIIIDAKYKPIYQTSYYDPENIRQVSGYARDSKIYSLLNLDHNTVIDCLIIYPEKEHLPNNVVEQIDLADKLPIDKFVRFFKLPVRLPKINKC